MNRWRNNTCCNSDTPYSENDAKINNLSKENKGKRKKFVKRRKMHKDSDTFSTDSSESGIIPNYFFKIRRPPQRRRRVTKEPTGVESQDADGESDVGECQARMTGLFIKRQNSTSNENCNEGPSTNKFQKLDNTEDKPDETNKAMNID